VLQIPERLLMAIHDRAKGAELAGPTWEEYGDWNDDPSQLRTDVFVVVSR
jgi:hypothetical protein